MAKIAIIGTGRMATGLGTGWARAGHTVIFGSRSPEAETDLAAEIAGARVASHSEAMAGSDVVVLTMPFTAAEDFAAEHAATLEDRLVIDITNPFDHLPDNRIAGAEITAQAIGPGARVVAAFKANFSDTLLEPVDAKHGTVRDVLFAGGNDEDKKTTSRLIRDLGFRPVDCGPLRNARILDGMVPLLVELDRLHRGGERRTSWKLLS